MKKVGNMQLKFWGIRGTFPIQVSEGFSYGGCTPCSLIKTGKNDLIIIDAGTGIKYLGDNLWQGPEKGPHEWHIFFTHFHLDHIMGLPFFAPLYSERVTLNIYTSYSSVKVKAVLNGFMGGKYFPLSFEDTASSKKYFQIPEKGLDLNGVEVNSCNLNHPQGALALRFKENNYSIVFATDTEPPNGKIDNGLAEFAGDSNIFIYDAAFTPEEYEAGKRGWGHSTWLDGTRLAKESGVKQLILSHFNPDHSDKIINDFVARAKERFPKTEAAVQEIFDKKENE